MKRSFFLVSLCALVVSLFTGALWVSSYAEEKATNYALDFNGSNQYVTFGDAAALDLATFTIETWFKREGTGVTVSTGTGGTVAIPLVTKGRGEADGNNKDANYFLGIRGSDNVLAADFEDMASGGNHPVAGVTPIVNGLWYHAAATYDGTKWVLYLNGVVEVELTVSQTPRWDSIQHAGLATAMNSSGAASGYFDGLLDEVRIWDHARSETEIRSTINSEITTPQTGLAARWGLNEGISSTAGSVPAGTDGTLINSPAWLGTDFPSVMAFRQGVNGYTGTEDTYIWETNPTTSYGSDVVVKWDTESSGGLVFGLLRFDDIFGAGADQVPTGATILSAIMTYTVNNVGHTADVNDALVDWTEAETYNGFGGEAGVQADEYGDFQDNAAGDPVGVYNIDVTGSLTDWALSPSLNQGWIFRPTGTNGVQVRSSEYGTIGQRPLLAVVFTVPASTPPDAPTDLSATAISHSVIQLAWTDNSDNEANFEIERSTAGAGGPFSPLTTVGANVITHDDAGLDPETEYCYRVRATNAAGNSAYTNVACDTTTTEPNNALDFGGTNAYVTFGDPAALDLGEFTLEAWFKREGTGSASNTGTGGFYAIPLITKGRGEADGDNRDMNYFLGIRESDNLLAADFEDMASGGNHPVVGVTPIVNDLWYHAAATYDGSKWVLYLNGMFEVELTVSQTPRWDSIQHAGLATAMNSSGTASGYLDGVLDEVRIWDYARDLTEIRSTINSEISTPQAGLVGRWGLNEATGTGVYGSAGTSVNGTIMGSSWSRVAGAPFDITFNESPDAPTLVSPADMATGVSTSPTLEVGVSDPESDAMTVRFYGRTTASGGEDFTLIGLPDTQFYTSSMNGGSTAIFKDQTQWIVDNWGTLNIVYVAHLGDCAQNGDANIAEWQNADTAMTTLETVALPDGIPFGIAVGNHDQSPIGDADGTTTYYNQFFGETRFSGRGYYGGHYGSNNDNHYDLFSASGKDFIVIYIEYDTSPDAAVHNWADSLLSVYGTRRGIVVSHYLIGTGNPGSFATQGQAIYDALKDNPNLFLMLCGHVDGEGQRTDVFSGDSVYTLLADYQGSSNGGNGWLRIMEFSPANDEIRVKTYSPWLDSWETDANSQFTLSYDMEGSAFQLIDTNTGVPSGSNTSVVWPGLSTGTGYEWYVEVSDSFSTTTGPVWSFTTGGPPPQYTLTVNTVGNGSVDLDPPGGLYDAGTDVELTAAADSGWAFSGWSGALSGSANPDTITMTGHKTVTATFVETYTLAAGDVIVSAFQSWNSVGTQDPAEFIELFNTTDHTISLENMELISRTDNDSDGELEIDWQLSASLTGKFIAPYGFFLVAESDVAAPSSLHDVETDMDLATGEGGVAERAISIELVIDSEHMDYVLYGRDDGQSPAGEMPPGDIAFDSTASWPRPEVCRNTLGTNSFQEGLISRETADDLHAGYDVLGYYTDEDLLGDGYPKGVWYSPHDNTDGGYQTRNSLSAAVPPPVPQHTLSVNVVGGGSVFLDPPGGTYDQGSDVELTAVPQLGWAFSGWSGDLTGGANPDTVTMDGDKNGTATFVGKADLFNLVCEDFESGFAIGDTVGAHADWFDDGGGPVVTSGIGVSGSIGLAAAGNIFTWTGEPFWWNANGLVSVTFQMDFQTDGEGHLDDDRIGWMIVDDDVGSSNIFGLQCDPGGSGYNIEGYWDGVTSDDRRPSIVDLPALSGNTFYRFRAEMAKLTATTAGIEVILMELNASGDPVALVAHGSIPNTADLGTDEPNAKYFVGPVWPAYKNYTSAGGPADNACFEHILEPPTAIELAGFEAVAGDGRVILTWRTAAEVNSHSFNIYRDGDRIAIVPAAGEAHDYIYVDRHVTNDVSYSYQLSDVDVSGAETLHPVISSVTPTVLPVAYSLSQNYPNPFNPTTEISYGLPARTHVTLKVYNLLGQEVVTLVDAEKAAGRHTASWNTFDGQAAQVASGIYFYRLETEDFSATRKMVFLK